MMSSLVYVRIVLCVRSGLKYQREIMCTLNVDQGSNQDLKMGTSLKNT